MKRRAVICLIVGLLSACDDMNKQAKTPTDGDKKGQVAVKEPEDMVAATPEVPPPALTRSLVERGHDEFHAFCAPCHSERGDGQGMVVQRGFPEPPSFHTDQARALAPAEIYKVISDGQGAMYSFAGRLRPADRWAVVAYVKALQISRNAELADVPADRREALP
jgi:mono/diheme cytochrome c family protein